MRHASSWSGTLLLALLAACGPVPAGNQNTNLCGLAGPECASEFEQYVCDGLLKVPQACAGYQVCAADLGCVDRVCTPGTVDCADEHTERRCVAPGHATEDEACAAGRTCEPAVGCEPPVCVDGQRTCIGPDEVGLCNAEHTGWDVELRCSDTDPTRVCHEGRCVNACEQAAITQAYLGCEYYGADLPQYPDNVTGKDYAIIVSNPSTTREAHVAITTADATVAELTVAPGGSETFTVLPPRPRNLPGAGIFPRAYRVTADYPVAAYQFSSLTTIGAASTDAAMLFTTHLLAKKYYVMDYTGFSGHQDGDNFAAIYATVPGTEVSVTPTVNLRASLPGSSTAFGVAPGGVPTTFALEPYDVLVLVPVNDGGDLTGTVVEGTEPIGVFGGNRCTNVPVGMSYCDHLEEQIFPRRAMGDRYLVAKSHARQFCDPPDYVRVLADADDTTVTFDPPVSAPVTLVAGEWREVSITAPTLITATHPLLVGQFLRSSNGGECQDEGDPSFILQVPVQQFRRSYAFLTPDTYTTDYLSIVAPPEAVLTLDGVEWGLSPQEIGTSGLSVTHVVLAQDGPHVVESTAGVGLIVYGFGGPTDVDPNGVVNVSYGYPAGLDLFNINPVE